MAAQEEAQPNISMMEKAKYSAILYGTMGKLLAEIQYLQYQIKTKKQKMGIQIYDAMQSGNHKEAEDQFMTTKKDVDDKLHTLKLKQDEYAQLKKDGESESVTKPGKGK